MSQPYHPAAQDWLPTEATQGWAGQYLDGRPPEKTRLLLEEVLVRPAGGAEVKPRSWVSVVIKNSMALQSWPPNNPHPLD